MRKGKEMESCATMSPGFADYLRANNASASSHYKDPSVFHETNLLNYSQLIVLSWV